jgi:hypothetical protein
MTVEKKIELKEKAALAALTGLLSCHKKKFRELWDDDDTTNNFVILATTIASQFVEQMEIEE